ncbi:MAG: histidine phosphatase family protein [Acholeplasmataceae bacterium]|jgi:broad specificity phosphatase PhoE|nr:histidine phosphatase family protein [Acholeplasmataceae bacterium]
MKLVMVRHGQTDYNAKRLVQGRINNPLNTHGKKQARELASVFINQEENFDAIVSSPLSRALETADIIRKKLKMEKPILVDHQLIERDFNELDGLSVDAAMPLVRQKGYSHPGYEVDEVLMKRVTQAILRLGRKYSGKNVLCVVHSHVIKALLVYVDPVQFSFADYLLQNGDLIYFEVTNNQIKFIKHDHHV